MEVHWVEAPLDPPRRIRPDLRTPPDDSMTVIDWEPVIAAFASTKFLIEGLSIVSERDKLVRILLMTGAGAIDPGTLTTNAPKTLNRPYKKSDANLQVMVVVLVHTDAK